MPSAKRSSTSPTDPQPLTFLHPPTPTNAPTSTCQVLVGSWLNLRLTSRGCHGWPGDPTVSTRGRRAVPVSTGPCLTLS